MYHQVVPAQWGFGAFLAIVHPSNVPFQFRFVCSRTRFVRRLQCAVQFTLAQSRGQKYRTNEVVELSRRIQPQPRAVDKISHDELSLLLCFVLCGVVEKRRIQPPTKKKF